MEIDIIPSLSADLHYHNPITERDIVQMKRLWRKKERKKTNV